MRVSKNFHPIFKADTFKARMTEAFIYSKPKTEIEYKNAFVGEGGSIAQ